MNCPNCGNELKEYQKFCTKCGTQLTTFNIRKNIAILFTTILLLISCIGVFSITKKTPQIQNVYELETPTEVLNKIDELQAQYFEIVKRNDVLLELEDNSISERDREDLKNLFKEVEHNIDKNNIYLQKYHTIEKKYANNPGMTTYDMDMFAKEHYQAVDDLLNETYQAVKAQIPKDDFRKLITSELRWLKEVEDYDRVFKSKGFGSIRGIVKYGYEIDMRSFRTLLLMLYL